MTPSCHSESNKSTSSSKFHAIEDWIRTKQEEMEMPRWSSTHIVLSDRSVAWRLRRYLAKAIPAGHNWPPHPSLRSSFSSNGSFRSPSKEMSAVTAALSSRGGARDSLILSPSGLEGGLDSGPGRVAIGVSIIVRYLWIIDCWVWIVDRRNFSVGDLYSGAYRN